MKADVNSVLNGANNDNFVTPYTLKMWGSKFKENNKPSTEFDKIYPVGSIYMSVNDTNPSSLFGGTWERLKGGFLYGAMSSWGTGNGTGTSTNSGGGGSTGGHTLTINEIPNHSHSLQQWNTNNSGESGRWCVSMNWNGSVNADNINYWTGETSSVGGNGSHNHSIPSHTHNIPYIAVFVWRRTN